MIGLYGAIHQKAPQKQDACQRKRAAESRIEKRDERVGKYARGAAYFFYDDVTFYQKWWPFAWLAIFGVFLVVMNKVCWKFAMKERE